MNIPSILRAGDTYSWTESNADYPATDGWTLVIDFRAKDKPPITITASSSGSDYAISISASDSKPWVAGTYSYQAYVKKESGGIITEKHSLEIAQVEILPDLTQATSQADLRSHAKKVLDGIEAILEGKALSDDAMSYSIGGRSISKMTPEELIKWRSFYKTEYERELEAEAVAKGLDSPRRIGVRFNRV
jgi:hypothetical protein